MKSAVDSYKTLVFDCDGVILHSNSVKTQAFYQAALPYGEAAAQALVDYHVQHGGVSRYKKFSYFVEYIVLGKPGLTLEELLNRYAKEVRDGLMKCEIAEGLAELRERTAGACWLIVSGGDQAELRDVFAARDIARFFDGGIFGSPDNKETILKREASCGNIMKPALFLGDSKYDYQAATWASLDFIFINEWSEIANWQDWVEENDLTSVPSLKHLD